MRSLVIIIWGSLPLAVLSIASLAEWVALSLHRTAEPPDVAAPAIAPLLVDPAAQADYAAAAQLAQSDLLASELTPPTGELPPQGSLGPLAERWRQWDRAREMAAAWTALPRPGSNGPLEPGQARLWQEFVKRYRSPPPGGQPLVDLAQAQVTAAGPSRSTPQDPAAAAALLQRARDAFAAGQMENTVALCDQWLKLHAVGAAADMVEKVDLLRRRAGFRCEADKLDRQLKTVVQPAQRRALLQPFLEKFGDPRQPTASEQQTLERLRQQLRESQP